MPKLGEQKKVEWVKPTCSRCKKDPRSRPKAFLQCYDRGELLCRYNNKTKVCEPIPGAYVKRDEVVRCNVCNAKRFGPRHAELQQAEEA